MADSNVEGRPTHFSGLAIKPRTLTSATLTLTEKDAGKTIITDIAATQTITLPAATGTGNVFRFLIGVTATGDKVIQVANSTDEFLGSVLSIDTDTGDAAVGFAALDADGFDTITLNGTTTGGIMGTEVVITDILAGKFAVKTLSIGSGIVATPFSAAV